MRSIKNAFLFSKHDSARRKTVCNLFAAAVHDHPEDPNYADPYSEYFILDGHHKLLAYQRFKILPPIVIIRRKVKSRDELFFDPELLIDALYPWHIWHMLDNMDEQQAYLAKKLSDPESKIHRFAEQQPTGFVVKPLPEKWRRKPSWESSQTTIRKPETALRDTVNGPEAPKFKFYEKPEPEGIDPSLYILFALMLVVVALVIYGISRR